MWSTVVLATMGVLAMFAPSAFAAPAPPPPQCHPSFLEDGSLRIRKICAALSTISELSNVMEAYLDEKTAAAAAIAAAIRPEDANSPLMDSGVKRQDVDHVFLRFGRR